MAYLTYEEYIRHGGTASDTDFVSLEFKCRKRIDRLTNCRIQNMEKIPEAVKLCMVSLVKLENTVGMEARVENPVVTSYNTDGYSESYEKTLDVSEASQTMDKIVLSMLYGELDDNGVPLLYRGVTGY